MSEPHEFAARESEPRESGQSVSGKSVSVPPVLELTDVVIHYGRIQALHGISLRVEAGELVTLLGANGAGKSTTMRGISGLNKLTQGDIRFNGESITRLAPHERVKRGIIQVPEGRRIFPGMTVLENLDMGCYGRKFENKTAYNEALEHVFEVFPRLGERRKQFGGTMSGGEQQMLAIGRALMTNPHLLILDEATEGLAPVIRTEIWHCIMQLREMGQSILLIDKNIAVLKKLADRHYIVEKGRTVWRGTSADLERDREQVHAYVGI